MGKRAKETQIRFKMQKDGEPVWDRVTIDKLWVTTQRKCMIESEPPTMQTSPQQSGTPEPQVKKDQTQK